MNRLLTRNLPVSDEVFSDPRSDEGGARSMPRVEVAPVGVSCSAENIKRLVVPLVFYAFGAQGGVSGGVGTGFGEDVAAISEAVSPGA